MACPSCYESPTPKPRSPTGACSAAAPRALLLFLFPVTSFFPSGKLALMYRLMLELRWTPSGIRIEAMWVDGKDVEEGCAAAAEAEDRSSNQLRESSKVKLRVKRIVV